MKYFPILLVLFFTFHQELSAENHSVETEDPGNQRWLGVWAAYSPVSVPLLARMRNARLALLGFDLQYHTFNIGNQSVTLSSELIVLGRTVYPANGISGPRESRFGLGLLPLRFIFPVYHHPSDNFLHIETGTGALLFDEPYPNRYGTLFNLIVDIGIGYNIKLTDSRSISLGYRFQHISNGGSGQINPGIDSNLFMFSLRSVI